MGDGQSLEGVQKEPFSSIVVVGLPPQQLKAGQRGEEIHPSNNTPQHDTKITHTTTITITITLTTTPFLRQ